MNIKYRKLVLWAVAAVVLGPISLYLIFLAVNRHDRPPSSAVLSFQEVVRSLPVVDDRENGFHLALGFSAPQGTDPVKAGRARAAVVEMGLLVPALGKISSFPGKGRDMLATQDPAIGALFAQCQTRGAVCVKALENADGLGPRLEREDWLLGRYQMLMSYRRWRELVELDPAGPMFPFAHVLEGQKLLMLKAWARAQAADAAGVKALLESDLRFWRHALAESDALINKMVAASAVKNNLAWTNILLRRLPADKIASAMPMQLSDPVSPAERSLLRPMAAEVRYMAQTVRHIKKDLERSRLPVENSGTVENIVAARIDPLLQVQDTINLRAGQLSLMLAAVNVGYAQMPTAIRRYRATAAKHYAPANNLSLYNPLGNVLIGAGATDMSTYAEKLADIEGLRRATLLAAQLRMRGVKDRDVAPALKQAVLRDPYDGRPFMWDAAGRAIVFTGLEKGARGRHAVLY